MKSAEGGTAEEVVNGSRGTRVRYFEGCFRSVDDESSRENEKSTWEAGRKEEGETWGET